MLCFELPIDLRAVSSFTRKRKLKTIGIRLSARINNSGGRRRLNTRNILAKSRRMTAIRCPRDQKPWINPYTHASSDLNPRELVARCRKWRIVRVIDNPPRIAPAKLFSVGEKPIPVVFALIYPLGKPVFSVFISRFAKIVNFMLKGVSDRVDSLPIDHEFSTSRVIRLLYMKRSISQTREDFRLY